MSRPGLLAALIAIASIAAISLVQPGLAASVHKVKQRDDVFLLPPPAELRAATFGYKAAATDLLWAKLILEHGLHWQERRPFPDVTRYVDGIIALEPDFPTLYRFVDTLLIYNPSGGTEDDARKYLEFGVNARPYDPDVWLQYGQFTAFLAASFLKDPAEIERWRVTGAHAIARAVLLGADAQRSLAVGAILDKAGDRDATIAFLDRAYALTDDPDMQQQYLLRLRKLRAESQAEGAAARTTLVEREWRTKYRFLSRGEAILVGPTRGVAACAGPSSYERRGCPRDWGQVVRDAR